VTAVQVMPVFRNSAWQERNRQFNAEQIALLNQRQPAKV
jgi:hypothetical protein